MTSSTILVTGGAGYIGSHTCVELIHAGYDVVVLDNLCNSRASVIDRVEQIAGRKPHFVQGDIRDPEVLDRIFNEYKIHAVIHFAGLKAVGESVAQPLRYYDNNVNGSNVLFEAMGRHGVKNIVFSSSATVYGDPASVPITEEFPLSATNPYGRSKLMVEQILGDLHKSDPSWRIALLRYFNPVGAHESGLIGEDPSGIPNNLLPFIAQVADGRRAALSVYGSDYPTTDGTGVRDYIHVVDLALGHLKTLRKLEDGPGVYVYNLGTGRGNSVLEMLAAFEKACGKTLPYQLAERRPGDIAMCYAATQRAQSELGWRAQRGVEAMCADTWRWQALAKQLSENEAA
ncbi:UDP-glucose 4-epimerase GalE [Herbaspirillum sp. LeCh32-8]|uniref:UDP-glucose 4-epimerase GalE n=1 Tax=Herbaspirillum sp. LeCh32-8 TaxID=2821356 RepID=UPI001AEA5884|nr:UDP-glucose 4-epimerase GalE [Herbaspirillum sp. LeCh32-8]MBP0596922.1 UDP-glucose 4-epimerase GalE [Herbaspirillum sp. LeCh32-8]